MTSGPYNDALSSWSRDGKWIYFRSNRTGRNEVWRIPFGEGAAQQITDNGGGAAFESADGRTLYYTKGGPSALFARPLAGGSERLILDYIAYWTVFAVFEDGIYYIGRPGADRQYPLQFFEFSTGLSRLLVKFEGPIQHGLGVSPDRKTILFTKSASTGIDLMLIENFR